MSETHFVPPRHCHLVSTSFRGWRASYGACQSPEEKTYWTQTAAANPCSTEFQDQPFCFCISVPSWSGRHGNRWTTCNAFCCGDMWQYSSVLIREIRARSLVVKAPFQIVPEALFYYCVGACACYLYVCACICSLTLVYVCVWHACVQRSENSVLSWFSPSSNLTWVTRLTRQAPLSTEPSCQPCSSLNEHWCGTCEVHAGLLKAD